MNIKSSPIQGYEDRYRIFEDGRVYSNPRKNRIKGFFLKPTITFDGYLTHGLSKDGQVKIFKLSRLVATHFIKNPLKKTTVNHKDGDKRNNHVTNLEWSTVSENNAHKFRVIGYKNANRKLTEDQVMEIKSGYSRMRNLNFFAVKFSVSRSTIWRVVNGQYYKGVKC